MKDIERLAGQRPLEQRETAVQRHEREAAEQAAKVKKAPPGSGPRPGDPPGEGAVEAPQQTQVEGFTPTRRPARDRRGRFTAHPEPPQEGVLRLTPRQPRAQQVRAVAAWLLTNLADGPVPAAPIRRAVRARKLRAKVLREACQRAGVVSYIEADGSETWGVLVTGNCPHCAKRLRCMECGATTVYPHREGILLTLKEAAPLVLMRPGSLRAYLNQHKAWYTPRYRRRRGGSRERVLSMRELMMVQAYAVRSMVYGKRKVGAVLANDTGGR